MSNKIIINCKEATQICDKNQYCEATTFDKIRLSIHNFLCEKCHLYSEQNNLMTKLFKANIKSIKHDHLCAEEKEKLKRVLEKKTKI